MPFLMALIAESLGVYGFSVIFGDEKLTDTNV